MHSRHTTRALTDAMPAAPVLVVEDESATYDVVRAYLEAAGFPTVVCAHGDRVLEVARQVEPRCVILDLMLPGTDGLTLCRQLRERDSTLPILMLSARASEDDRITGLRTGADDYLVKPFAPREVVARVESLLRRAERAPRSVPVLRRENVELLRGRQQATVDGLPLQLTQFEFHLLAALLDNPEQVMTRPQLIRRMHGGDSEAGERTVDIQVTRVRAKLRRAGSALSIATVHGLGYRLEAGR